MPNFEIIKGEDNGNPPDTLREMYPKVNRNFDKTKQEFEAQEARIDNILNEPDPNKDLELVDIRTPATEYTPEDTIEVAGDMTRDMQKQFVSHVAKNAQEFDKTVKLKDLGFSDAYIPLRPRSFIGRHGGVSRVVRTMGRYAYIGAENRRGVAVIDISIPSNPAQIGFVDLDSSSVYDIEVDGNLLYVAVNGGIHIADISDKHIPRLISYFDFDTPVDGEVRGLRKKGDYIYFVSTLGYVVSLDVSDPESPVQVDYVTETELTGAYIIRIQDDVAYVGTTQGRIVTIDISNPSDLVQLSFVRNFSEGMNDTRAIYVRGDYAYVGSNNTQPSGTTEGSFFGVIDISDPSNLSIMSYIRSLDLDFPRGMQIKNNIAYIANRDGDKVTAIDVSDPENLSVISSISISNGGSYDLDITGDFAYVVSDNVFTVVDISNPYDMNYEHQLYTDNIRDTRDLYVSGNYIYMGTLTTSKFTIVDIADLNHPFEVGSIGTPELDGSNGVVVVGQYCYVGCRDSGSFVVIDIKNPAKPEQVAAITDYKLLGARRVVASDGYAYVAIGHLTGDPHSNAAIAAIDISDPLNPFIADYLDMEQACGSVIVGENGVLFVSSYGQFGTQLYSVDASDPTDLKLIQTITESVFSSVRGMSMKGNIIFLSSSGNSSLHAIDVSKPDDMTVIGTIQDNSLAGARSNDVFGNYVYVSARSASSVTAIDVTDPTDMKVVDSLELSIFNNAYGLRVSKGAIFVSSALTGNTISILG